VYGDNEDIIDSFRNGFSSSPDACKWC